MRKVIRNREYSRTAVQETLHFVDYLLQLSVELGPIIRKKRELMELYNKENASPTVMNAFDLEFEKGIAQEKREVNKKLLLNNIPVEMIITVTDLTLEEVKEIQKTFD